MSGSSPETTLTATPSAARPVRTSVTPSRSSSASATSATARRRGQPRAVRRRRGARPPRAPARARAGPRPCAGGRASSETTAASARAGRTVDGAPRTRAVPSASVIPLQRSDERNSTSSSDLGGLAGQRGVRGQGGGGGVGARHRAGEGAEQRPRARLVAPRGHDLHQGEPPAGQRAGLVGAHDVDAADRLDGVGLLHERPAPADARGPDRVGDGDEEEQAVGHEAREHRGGLHEAQHRRTVERRPGRGSRRSSAGPAG